MNEIPLQGYSRRMYACFLAEILFEVYGTGTEKCIAGRYEKAAWVAAL